MAQSRLLDADTIIRITADVGGAGYLKASTGRAFEDMLRLGLNVIRTACCGNYRRLILACVPRAYAGDSALPLRELTLEISVPSRDTGNYTSPPRSWPATSAGCSVRSRSR